MVAHKDYGMPDMLKLYFTFQLSNEILHGAAAPTEK